MESSPNGFMNHQAEADRDKNPNFPEEAADPLGNTKQQSPRTALFGKKLDRQSTGATEIKIDLCVTGNTDLYLCVSIPLLELWATAPLTE